MALVSDAVCAEDFKRPPFSLGRVSEIALEKIYADLDYNEVVSIIFLMIDTSTDISAVINALRDDCKSKFFAIKEERNWGEKLLDALITIDNIDVIIKLGFKKDEIQSMKGRYFYDIHNVSQNLNKVVKSLYFLCRELTNFQVKKLVNEVYKDLGEPVPHLDEEEMLLEIYILDWLKKKYISIDKDNPDLNKFIGILKIINISLPLSLDFEGWKDFKSKKPCTKNKQDSSLVLGQFKQLQNNTCTIYTNDSNRFPWHDKEHNRLCIIVNQVDFTDKCCYQRRKGSDIDNKALYTTFKGMGFHVKEERNLTAAEMRYLLNSLNEDRYNNYAAIFLCILSHGQEGKVIFSDDKWVTVQEIKQKVCCRNLKNVFKFVILQSCQGMKIGFVNSSLTSDSPVVSSESLRQYIEESSPLYSMHFGLYQATVDEYISIRHETEGSWFIQEACKELQKTTPIKLTEWVTNVNKRVNSCKAETNVEDTYIVQVPCCKESTISEDYVFPKYYPNKN